MTQIPRWEGKGSDMENFTGTSDTRFDRIKWFIGLNLAWLLLCVLAVWLGWRSGLR